MATVNCYNYIIATVNGKRYEFGSLTEPQAITAAGNDVYELVTTVATSTAIEIFDVADDLADFDFLIVACDQDLMLEMVVDDNAGVGEEEFTVKLTGSGTTGEWGVPFILSSDVSYANYTQAFAAGTLDKIERLTVKNLSAVTTAQVLCLAFT